METQHNVCIIKLWYEPVLWLLVYLCDLSQCMEMQTFHPLHNQDVNRTLFREVKAVQPLYEAAFVNKI